MFKVGDRVYYKDSINSGIGIISDIFSDIPFKLYAIDNVNDIYGVKRRRHFLECELKTLQENKEELKQRELKRLEHISEDPFGEEVW